MDHVLYYSQTAPGWTVWLGQGRRNDQMVPPFAAALTQQLVDMLVSESKDTLGWSEACQSRMAGGDRKDGARG